MKQAALILRSRINIRQSCSKESFLAGFPLNLVIILLYEQEVNSFIKLRNPTMEKRTLALFLEVRENFNEIKGKVSLVKPYLELMCLSTSWTLKVGEFERILGFAPDFLYRSDEEIYAMSLLYRVDDDITRGIIAHQFSSIIGLEKNMTDLGLIDGICVERGFGEELLCALRNDILPGMIEREFISGEHLEARIGNLKKIMSG